MVSSATPPPLPTKAWLARFCGRTVAQPWFDPIAIRAVTRLYFPLSRGWAAACAADGDAAQFRELTSTDLSGFAIEHALATVRRSAADYAATWADWQRLFFAPRRPSPDRLVAVEDHRRRAALRFMLGRSAFLPWLPWLSPVRWSVNPPSVVEARHGSRLSSPDAAYPPPPGVDIEVSHAIAGAGRRTYWLRFSSPVLGDAAWAKVIEPESMATPPTLLVLHGIGIELEMWPPVADPIEDLVDRGVRIVRPIAPWHAQRTPRGFYGGEPILARGPEGVLTFFEGAVSETAVLLAWLRGQGTERVAIGGVSLGALTAQMVASAGRWWPTNLQPSALLLVTTTAAILDLIDGSLCRGAGFSPHLERSGWTGDALRRWLPLLQPDRPPLLSADRIVIVLGENDDLMPYAGGRRLVERWRAPADNVFVRRQGHFSVPLGLIVEPAPIDRLFAMIRDDSAVADRAGQGGS